jgi:hypothetical protein
VHFVRVWIIVILEAVSQFHPESPLVVAGFAQRVAEPLQTLVETVTIGSTCRLDVLLHRQCGATLA